MPVLLAQCLCPSRHCIMALPGFDEAQLRPALEKLLEWSIKFSGVNPWCGICRAPRKQWRIEVAATRYETMEEALPHLRAVEAEQTETRRRLENTQN